MEGNKNVILIVEDDQQTETALKQKLESEGFIVDLAKSGAECLECIEKRTPDLIFLDVMMPVMDGMETLKRLKERSETKDIPVVVLTNIDDEQKISEALENNAQDYLLKTDQTLEGIVDYIRDKLS
jgi:CheY-like chemotaxis protein